MQPMLGIKKTLKDTPLSNFFKQINFRKGRVSAISATARKLAVIIWNIVIKKQPYKNEHGYEFLDQKRKRKLNEMRKLIHKFDIKSDELELQKSFAYKTDFYVKNHKDFYADFFHIPCTYSLLQSVFLIGTCIYFIKYASNANRNQFFKFYSPFTNTNK